MIKNQLNPRGRFVIEHFREGEKINQYEMPNGITDEGKDLLLDVMFNDETAVASTSWYVGLIDLSSFSALADADTHASHGGWIELTIYSEANRVAWGPGAAASQSTTNASPATFNITGSGTCKGVFIASDNTKGGTGSSYTLWATALFSADVPVANGDQLKITYTVSA